MNTTCEFNLPEPFVPGVPKRLGDDAMLKRVSSGSILQSATLAAIAWLNTSSKIMKTTNKIFWLIAVCASAPCASAGVLFQDNFDTFSLGTVWNAGPEGIAPDQTLQVINSGGND